MTLALVCIIKIVARNVRNPTQTFMDYSREVTHRKINDYVNIKLGCLI
jgi:hypothetical protein